MDAAEQIKKFQEYLETNCNTDLMESIRKGNNYFVIDFLDLSKFDIEIANELLETPEESIKAAEIAVEQFDTPQETVNFRIRFKNLPDSQDILIREIRSAHIGKFISLDGVVRQKSDVRPQVTSAKFECPVCGNVLNVLQLDQKFKEPSKCGCGRKGKFRLLNKELIDAQGIVLEENTDDLEGGEQPKRMNLLLKEDLVSPISDKRTNPGTKIKVTGFVKEVPIIMRSGGQSTRFDLIIEANHIDPVEEDYSEIQISKEDIDAIKTLAKDPKIYLKMVEACAPSIYGYDKIKEAILYSLIGGVKKIRTDGASTRGDIHILLIGDPGAEKCLHGDTKILLSNGEIKRIKDLVDEYNIINDNVEIESLTLPSLFFDGKIKNGKGVRVWKRKINEKLLVIKTRRGVTLKLTKNHPLFQVHNGLIIAKDAQSFKVGERIAAPRSVKIKNEIQTISNFIPKYAKNSKKLKYPEFVSLDLSRLLGYLCGDGYVAYSKTSAWVSLTNEDNCVLNDFSKLIKSLFDVNVTERDGLNKTKEIYTLSKNLVDYLNLNFKELMEGSLNKSIPNLILKSSDEILSNFISALFECDANINVKKRQIEFSSISKNLAENIQLCLLRFGVISLFKEKIKFATNTVNKRKVKSYEIIIGGEFVKPFINKIGFLSKRKKNEINLLIQNTKLYNTNIDLIPNINDLLKKIRIDLKLKQSEMGIIRSSYAHYEQNNRLPSVSITKKISQYLSNIDLNDVKKLNQISHADVFWDEILSIKEELCDDFVYDLEIESTHNYIANGVVVHNSQLLKRASKISTKARFVSGKGASGAGLTAAVVKDEFLGGWSLEAGALVLANKGLVCIDELDKMSPEDRSAMHEALEGQTITISKANIQATLRCETTVLAAANPKFGRFDPYDIIGKQINLPPALISRFDLIFPIKDLPDEKKDAKMASFILESHKTPDVDETEISTDILRKYIAYARRFVSPTLSDEAIEDIQKYYVQMRNSSSSEEAGVKAVPITTRQLEAIIRLAEAACKLRLGDEVLKEDTKKSIDLLNFCLTEVGLDPDTGKIDIDRITSGITSSARNKISIIKEILNELENQYGKAIPLEEIVNSAKEKGLNENEVEEIVDKLKRGGDIFEPRRGLIQRL